MARDQNFESPLLARYKPLIHNSTRTTSQQPALEVRLDPICSRSCITRRTLCAHFPTLLNKTYPNRPPSRSGFEGSPPIKIYDCITLFLDLQDVEGEKVKIEVKLRICEDSEGSKMLDGKVVLGVDFWERGDVVVSWPEVKRKEEGAWLSWRGKDSDEFLGIVVGEQKVRFQRSVQVMS